MFSFSRLHQSTLEKGIVFSVFISTVLAAIGDPINCMGSLRSSVISIYPNTELSALDICTSAQDDNGINRGLGGVCGSVGLNGLSPVIFSTFPEVERARVDIGTTWANLEHFAPWVAFFCRDNCWCSTDAEGRGPNKPKGFPRQSRTMLEPLGRIYQFDLESGPRYSSTRNRRTLRLTPQTLALRTHIQPFKYSPIAGSYEFEKILIPAIPVALDPSNIIECNRQPLPAFENMPGPYTRSDFNLPIELCATALSGGNPGANAGGFCRRTSPRIYGAEGGDEYSFGGDVSFNRLFSPRREFTIPTDDFVAQLHYECWKRCWCKNHENRRRIGRTHWSITNEEGLVKDADGSIHLIYKHLDITKDTKVSDTFSIGENRQTSHSSQGSCSSDSDKSCSLGQQEVEAEAGEEDSVASASPFSKHLFPISDSIPYSGVLPTCGHTCRAPSDCSGSDTITGCQCTVVTDTKIARLAGIVPIFPVALCLVLPRMQAYLSSSNGGGGGSSSIGGLKISNNFPKRKTKRNLDTDSPLHPPFLPFDESDSQEPISHQWTCHCNATVVSEACCMMDEWL